MASLTLALTLALASCAHQNPVAKGLERIYFDDNKYNIKTEYLPVMKANAVWLKAHPTTSLLIEGHSDGRGANEYNIGLGDRRARSAETCLIDLGIGMGRISTISYGKNRPTCTEHNEDCWRENRRVEFVAK